MYTISVMPESDVHFGECIEDGFYVEGKSHMEVQEKLEQHEMELEKEKEERLGNNIKQMFRNRGRRWVRMF